MGLWQIICIVVHLIFFVTSFINAMRQLNNTSTYIISGWFKHAVASFGWFILDVVIAAIATYFIINDNFVFN